MASEDVTSEELNNRTWCFVNRQHGTIQDLPSGHMNTKEDEMLLDDLIQTSMTKRDCSTLGSQAVTACSSCEEPTPVRLLTIPQRPSFSSVRDVEFLMPDLHQNIKTRPNLVRQGAVERFMYSSLHLSASVPTFYRTFASHSMRGALSLFLLCVALSQAIVYETSTTTIPTTGYFSPIYKADSPALFNYNYRSSESLNSLFICDGQVGHQTQCSTFQVALYSSVNQSLVTSELTNITVTQTDIVQVTLGQTYTSINGTYYTFSADVPYLYTLSTPGSFFFGQFLGFSGGSNVDPNVTLTTRGSVYPLYASTYPQTFAVDVKSTGGFLTPASFVYQNVTYNSSPSICTLQSAAMLLDGAQTGSLFSVVFTRGCSNVFGRNTGAQSATIISLQTPPTLSASTTGNYSATCQKYGNSSDYYALVKLVNNEVTSEGGFINEQQISSQVATFDAAYNCGNKTSIALSIQVNGPYQPVSLNSTLPVDDNLPVGFYQVNLAAGTIGDYQGGSPANLLNLPGCYPATSFNYFGYISGSSVDVCNTVTGNSTFNVPAFKSAFVVQPPEGYCIRSDGIPSNSSNSVYLYSSTSSTLFYEDEKTTLFTLTCSSDIFYVQLGDLQPMTVNFTLVPINGQGVYGQTYNVNGFLVLQYPPLTAPVGIFSINVTGSAVSLQSFSGNNLEKRNVNNAPPYSPNVMLMNTSGVSSFIVAVTGQGQVSTNIGTPAGVNVGFDANYSINPTTSTSSSTTSSTFGSDSSNGSAGTDSSVTASNSATTSGVTGTSVEVKPVGDASVIKATFVSAVMIFLALF
ncbi:hemagluttinin family protein [Planoprotostelium fungivorum]|uniref:Hemagluttinin family protein n=1 Tax=Planoprotostelium fungivorum TaxID=1890364 RepID=A0A2P6N0C6_9EUKA|nr:hemagluttinin family protein [Planoprotostelium fungivorum]